MSTGASSAQNESYFQAIRPGKSQRITTSGTSQVSNILQTNPRTTLVSFFATADCWVLIGESGATTAAVNDGKSMFVAGGIRDFMGIEETLHNPVIAVIQDNASGYFHIVECADPGVKQG